MLNHTAYLQNDPENNLLFNIYVFHLLFHLHSTLLSTPQLILLFPIHLFFLTKLYRAPICSEKRNLSQSKGSCQGWACDVSVSMSLFNGGQCLYTAGSGLQEQNTRWNKTTNVNVNSSVHREWLMSDFIK